MNKDDLEIFNKCEERWDFYEERDGGYFPSKHDEVVFQDVSKELNISIEEVGIAFNRVAKIIANNKDKGMSDEQLFNQLKEIVKGNKDLPFGKIVN